MRDIPIIFSGPMVRALLDGRKTMTRRLRWREPTPFVHGTKRPPKTQRPLDLATPWQKVKPGDRLWVRENWAWIGEHRHTDHRSIYWSADRADWPTTIKWTPSIHMPRWASRLTLVVTAVKIEKLQAITDADATAEGVIYDPVGFWTADPAATKTAGNLAGCSASGAFCALWCHLHGLESWDANPEVVALTFTVHKQNIDTLAKQEAA